LLEWRAIVFRNLETYSSATCFIINKSQNKICASKSCTVEENKQFNWNVLKGLAYPEEVVVGLHWISETVKMTKEEQSVCEISAVCKKEMMDFIFIIILHLKKLWITHIYKWCILEYNLYFLIVSQEISEEKYGSNSTITLSNTSCCTQRCMGFLVFLKHYP